MIVSIDFSINSTAMMITNNGGSKYFSFIPAYKGIKPFLVHRALSEQELLTVIEYGPRERPKDYTEREIANHQAAERLANAVADQIEAMLDGTEIEVGFEGFSYGSKGASFIDLIVFNTFCKKEIMNRFGCDVSVYSPSAIKRAYTDKGNSRKPEMYRSFLGTESGEFRDAVYALVGDYSEDMKVPKPIDDIVDSVAIHRLMEDK